MTGNLGRKPVFLGFYKQNNIFKFSFSLITPKAAPCHYNELQGVIHKRFAHPAVPILAIWPEWSLQKNLFECFQSLESRQPRSCLGHHTGHRQPKVLTHTDQNTRNYKVMYSMINPKGHQFRGNLGCLRRKGGIKSEKNFITFYDEGHRDLHNAFYRIKKY